MSASVDPLMKVTESNLGSVILCEDGTVSRINSAESRRYDEQDIVTLPKSMIIEEDDPQPACIADRDHYRGVVVDDDIGQFLGLLGPDFV